MFLEYDNNIHFEGIRFICGMHLVIIGLSEARANLMTRYRGLQMSESYAPKMNTITIITHFVGLLQLNAMHCKKSWF